MASVQAIDGGRAMSDELAAVRGPITFALMLAALMNALDVTIANVALPHIQGSLSASPEQITWVVTSYIVTAAVMTPISGWLAGRFGLKRMLIASIVGFTLASMLCGVAASLAQMVLFRVVQAAFGAALVPLSQTVLLNINPPERHARAMATWSMATMLAPVAGPVLGGYLTDQFSWRWCFYINLPFGALALLMLVLFMPRQPQGPYRRFDFLGFSALTIGVAAFQLMLDRGTSQDWFSSREIWIGAITAAIAIWIFVTHSLTAEHPMFDRALAADRNLITATLFGFLIAVLMYSSLTILPVLMQTLMGYPVMFAGMVTAPRGMAMMIVMMIMGAIGARLDLRIILGTGLGLCALAFWQMSRFDLSMGPGPLVVSGVIQGLGQGMMFVPLSTLAFATIGPALRAEASSIYNLLRNVGGSIGIALMQAMAASNGQVAHASLAAYVIPTSPVVRFGLPRDFAPETIPGALALNAEITRQATMIAYLDDFRIMLALSVGCLPLLFLLRPPRRRPATA